MTGHLVDLAQFDDDISASIVQILTKAESDILGQLALIEPGSPRSLTQRAARLETLLEQVRGTLAAAYGDVVTASHSGLAAVAEFELGFAESDLSQWLGQTVGGLVNVNTVAVSPELISRIAQRTLIDFGEQGGAAVVSDWFLGQLPTTQQAIAEQLQQGILHGEGTAEMIRRIKGGGRHTGVMKISKDWAKAITRTSVTGIVNEARLETFEASGGDDGPLKGIYQVSTLDSRTTQVCIVYAGKAWLFGPGGSKRPSGHSLPYAGGVPRHVSCRSTVNPWVKSWEEMGLDSDELSPGLRKRFDGKVPDEVGGEKWLRGQPPAVQNQILGKGTATLFRDGKVKWNDLVDADGQSRTLTAILANPGVKRPRPTTEKPTTGGVPFEPPEPRAVPQVPDFRTVAEGEEWLRQNYTKAVDLPGVRLGDLKEIIAGMHQVLYARLSTQLNTIGWVPKGQNRGVFGTWSTRHEVRFQKTYTRNAAKQASRQQELYERQNADQLKKARAQLERAREGNFPEAAIRRFEERVRNLEVADTWMVHNPERELFTLAAHEAGHAIEFQRAFRRADDRFKAPLFKLFEDNIREIEDLKNLSHRVSEYAASNTEELWAEITALVATGRASEVPEELLRAWTLTIEHLDDAIVRGALEEV